MMQYLVLFWITFATFSLQAKTVLPDKISTTYQDHLLNAHQQFKAKNYRLALAAYEQSYALTPLDSTLYNIAICQFKLKNWRMALDKFEALSTHQGSTDLIEYNIAVVHKKLGNTKKANNQFLYLSEYAEDANIVNLANQQLDKTEIQNTTPIGKNTDDALWQNLLNLQLGNDSNIVLPDDENYTEQRDQFASFLFSTSYLSSADLSNAWLVDFSYYSSKYNEATNYEVSMFALEGRKYFSPKNLANTRLYAGVAYESLDLSNTDYLDTVSLNLGAEYKLSNKQKLLFDISLRNAAEKDDRFDYLAGSSNRYKLTWKHLTDNGYWKIGGKYQVDDKDDRYQNDEFVSYSSNRFSLLVSRNWQYQQWDFTLGGQYRFSKYHDNNSYIDDAEERIIDDLREDDRINLYADLTYNINDNVSINTELDYTNNSSTLEENEYDQNTFNVGVTWLF